MEHQNQVIELVQKQPAGLRLKQAVVGALAVAFANVVCAASSIPATGLTDEIDGSKGTVLTLFGAALTIIGIYVGWRYLKRGANSA